MHHPRGNNFQLTSIRNIHWSLLLDTCAVMRLGMYHNLQSNPAANLRSLMLIGASLDAIPPRDAIDK